MEELINLITAFLIEAKKESQRRFYSIKEILKKLNITDLSFQDIFDLTKYLENVGVIEANYIMGDALVKLTIKGEIEFEKLPNSQKDEYHKKIIDLDFENDIDNILTEFDENNVETAKQSIIDYIKEIIDKEIPKLGSLDWNAESYKTDLNIMLLELEKKNPDKEILQTKLFSLMDCIPLRSKIKELKAMFNLDK